MQSTSSEQLIDNDALKAQVDSEIAARLELEAEYARYIHRRGFRIGDLNLLVNLDAASEVAEMPPLFRLPGAPSGVKGLANRHGRVVPVLDLYVLFGDGSESKESPWLLVYGRGDEAVGISVDSLPDRKKFSNEDAASVEELTHPIAKYARAVYRENETLWIDVDMEELFASVFQVEASTE